jgi:hypothetical protein
VGPRRLPFQHDNGPLLQGGPISLCGSKLPLTPPRLGGPQTPASNQFGSLTGAASHRFFNVWEGATAHGTRGNKHTAPAKCHNEHPERLVPPTQTPLGPGGTRVAGIVHTGDPFLSNRMRKRGGTEPLFWRACYCMHHMLLRARSLNICPPAKPLHPAC